MGKNGLKKKRQSLMVQLIFVPMAILGIILVGQLLYGIRVGHIMNRNAREIRTATLKEIASGLQTDLNQYKLFVANGAPATSVQKALTRGDELTAFQAKQSLLADWTVTFQLYPELGGIFLQVGEDFWCMANPWESMQNPSPASLVLKKWIALYGENEDPYLDSWTLLSKDEEGQILACALREEEALFGVWLDVDSISKKVSQYYENHYQYIFAELPDEALLEAEQKSITVFATLEKGKFAIMEQVGRQELLRELYRLNFLLLGLILCTILLLSWYMYINYHRIAQAIGQLIGTMHETMRTGRIIMAEDDVSFREFHELTEIYNSFVERIDSLEDHIAQEKIKYQEVRRQYLELQIRPHFYVNIISGILGYLNSRNIDSAKNLLQCMASHLSYILYNREGMARLGDELRFAENYVMIQKLRFGGQFDFHALVDPEFMDILVPVLSVQTFIENAAKYVSRSEGICVSLKAELIEEEEAEFLLVTISDNGSGFPKEVLEAFAKKEEIFYQGRKHIGIWNLYERMEELYGEDASLDLFNGADMGAWIRWRVPVR